MFNFLKNTLQKIYSTITEKLAPFLGRTSLNETDKKELEKILISADTGVKTTRTIITHLEQQLKNKSAETNIKTVLSSVLIDMLNKPTSLDLADTVVFLLVGINGSGKTTFVGKLAHHLAAQGKRVLLIAADTFRAAAPEQLNLWAQRTGAHIVMGKSEQDPASVVFTGCSQFKQGAYDVLIIDTAGRLHTKTNLMHELAKIKRVISQQLPGKKIITLLTIDSMLGQNSLEQAKLFKEYTDVSGIVLTKMDGTGKGGIVFAIAHELNLPVIYITFGEQLDQIKQFDAAEYVYELLNVE
jgi:fused signal recognition particle receptor